MKTKEELAKEFANNLESIQDLRCPRDIINPGLWFGFMKGYEAYTKIHGLSFATEKNISNCTCWAKINPKDYRCVCE